MKNYKEIRNCILKDFHKKNRILELSVNTMIFLLSFFEISISWVIQKAINSISEDKSFDELISSVLCAAIVLVLINLFNYIMQRLQNVYLKNFSIYLKDKMFSELINKSVTEFDTRGSGEYISAFQTDVQRLSRNYISGLWLIIGSVSTCILGIASMFAMSVKLSLLIIIIQMIPVSLTLVIGKVLQKIEKQAADARGNFNSCVQDYLRGFGLVKQFSVEKCFINRFSESNINVENCEKIYKDRSISISLINTSANFLMIICIFFIGGLEAIKGNIKIGTVIALFQLFNMISAPLSTITIQMNLVKTSNVLFKRIFDLFYQKSDTSGTRDEKLEHVDCISMTNVSFSYDNERSALYDICCTFEKGKKYAVVGNSGSGKTTFIKLMMGYYDNFDGEILLNDKDIRNIRMSDINREISLVQQDVFVFNDTVRFNITFDTDYDAESIENAIGKAGLTEFINDHGEDYICGENGINISGGEKQRISIARSLLKNSSVIIFDEATSSLDNVTALGIENTISNLEQICISITHRMSLDALKNYDEIIVMDDGRICEKGSADELMENGKIFRKLYYASLSSDGL